MSQPTKVEIEREAIELFINGRKSARKQGRCLWPLWSDVPPRAKSDWRCIAKYVLTHYAKKTTAKE